MNSEKYNRNIQLFCPTCGCDQFGDESKNDACLFTCASCGRTITRDELEQGNLKNINAHIDEMTQEVEQDFEKEINAMLKKSFSGMKNVKFK